MTTLTNDVLTYFGNFITLPSDIVNTRFVSNFFKKNVCDQACKAFFIRHERLISQLGFSFLLTEPYENFKSFFKLIAARLGRKTSNLNALFAAQNRLHALPHLQFPSEVLPTHWKQYQRRDLRSNVTFWEWIKSKDLQGVTSLSPLKNVSMIPHEITTLTQLHKISLSNTRIRYVPTFLSQLKELRFLFLLDNCIESVYCSFAEMPQLRHVNLTHNRLERLPPSTLFNPEECLCLTVDTKTLLNSIHELDQYPSVFFSFLTQKPDEITEEDFRQHVSKVITHNAYAFQKCTNKQFDLNEEIPIKQVNDMLDWNSFHGFKEQSIPLEEVERRLFAGVQYLCYLMPSRRQRI